MTPSCRLAHCTVEDSARKAMCPRQPHRRRMLPSCKVRLVIRRRLIWSALANITSKVRTFKMLKKHNVLPNIEPDLRLVHCSGKDVMYDDEYSRPTRSHSGNGVHRKTWVDKVDTKFYTSLIAALVSQPRFLSVTLTDEDEPSLLLDRCLLESFGDSLIGPTEADLTPIFLDLVDLPFEATGIVAGVAGKLAEDMMMEQNAELSYLSTAKTGAVILSSELADKAMETLSPLLMKEG